MPPKILFQLERKTIFEPNRDIQILQKKLFKNSSLKIYYSKKAFFFLIFLKLLFLEAKFFIFWREGKPWSAMKKCLKRGRNGKILRYLNMSTFTREKSTTPPQVFLYNITTRTLGLYFRWSFNEFYNTRKSNFFTAYCSYVND